VPTLRSTSLSSVKPKPSASANALLSAGVSNDAPRTTQSISA